MGCTPKGLIVFIGLFLSFSGKISAEEPDRAYQISQKVLDTCEQGVLGIVDGKAYLDPDWLGFFHPHTFLLNDSHQWVLLGPVQRDHIGFYVYAQSPECPEGHPGFKKVGKTWYCLKDGCPYFYGNDH